MALVLMGGSYALTAANTVPGSQAGQGATTISGYTVGAVKYTLSGTDASQLSAVEFTLAPPSGGAAPTTVKARTTSAGTYVSCTFQAGPADWTCPVTGSVNGANNLDVVAVQ
jgi:hypothetical protein